MRLNKQEPEFPFLRCPQQKLGENGDLRGGPTKVSRQFASNRTPFLHLFLGQSLGTNAAHVTPCTEHCTFPQTCSCRCH